MSEGEGFLSRWSRRKRTAAVAIPAPPQAAAPPVPPEAAPSDAAAPPGVKPAFDLASLPPVESLTSESDFAAFLREEVPATLRQAALRRAWTLDPAIRDFVGPADYAWDYNAADGVPGFSLDVPADLERLVAQAIGSVAPPAKGEAPGGGGVPPPPAEAAAPRAEPAPPEDPPADTSVAGVAVGEKPAPEALPALATPVAEVPPVRRRHGGALPS